MKIILEVLSVFFVLFLIISGIIFVGMDEYVLAGLDGIGLITFVWIMMKINKDNEYGLFK